MGTDFLNETKARRIFMFTTDYVVGGSVDLGLTLPHTADEYSDGCFDRMEGKSRKNFCALMKDKLVMRKKPFGNTTRA